MLMKGKQSKLCFRDINCSKLACLPLCQEHDGAEAATVFVCLRF